MPSPQKTVEGEEGFTVATGWHFPWALRPAGASKLLPYYRPGEEVPSAAEQHRESGCDNLQGGCSPRKVSVGVSGVTSALCTLANHAAEKKRYIAEVFIFGKENDKRQ